MKLNRFSVRCLLVITLLFALLAAWFIDQRESFFKEHRISKTVEAMQAETPDDSISVEADYYTGSRYEPIWDWSLIFRGRLFWPIDYLWITRHESGQSITSREIDVTNSIRTLRYLKLGGKRDLASNGSISPIPNLQELRVREFQFTTREFEALSSSPELHHFEMCEVNWDPAATATLSLSNSIRTLWLDEVDGLTFLDVQKLLAIKSLKRATFRYSNISNSAKQPVGGNSNLQELDISGCSISDEQLIAILDQAPNIKRLSLDSCNLSNHVMPRVAKLSRLVFVEIDNTKITSEGFKLLLDSESIRVAYIGSRQKSPEEQAMIEKITEELHLRTKNGDD